MKGQKHEPTLEEVYKLAKANNKMLRAMRRDALIGTILKFVWWIAILFVIPYILYVLYLQPYLENIQAAYQGLSQSADSLNSAAGEIEKIQNSIPNFQDILDRFGSGGN